MKELVCVTSALGVAVQQHGRTLGDARDEHACSIRQQEGPAFPHHRRKEKTSNSEANKPEQGGDANRVYSSISQRQEGATGQYHGDREEKVAQRAEAKKVERP
jgi:hypothetical protein